MQKRQPSGALPGLVQKISALYRRGPKRFVVVALLGVTGVYVLYLAVYVMIAFEDRRWDIPAQVYAAPLELYAGLALTADQLEASLQQSGYDRVAGELRPGQYRVDGRDLTLWSRTFRHWDALEPSQQLKVSFNRDRVVDLRSPSGELLPLVRLEPVRLGSLFTSHHEDRILVGPDEIPPLLIDALKAVEDRRFDTHNGLDLIAIGRAAWVNLRAGEIRQGGSTLTQQLVKSYFLHSGRTFRRKFREAVMAVALELRYDKTELLHAYINEIYLGQQGARAIHGFGLASEYYFAKRLSQLDVQEIALLIALVKGPSYYDPRRHPERARERRDQVLGILAEQGVISEARADSIAASDLGVMQGNRMMSRYQPAYMDLVRQQLSRDYDFEDLSTAGLRVFTSLDPQVQSLSERELAAGLGRLAPPGDERRESLEGAVVVTRQQTGEVLALVGGRDAEFDGFNRALAARRPAGSLVKPVVYLAALQSGRYNLASTVLDEPIDIELENGDTWSPKNFSETSHGEVPFLRALADSYNQATVRLGMDIGVGTVATLFHKLGLAHTPAPNPSLLLGAVDMTPFEVAGIYGSLANGGFRVPLRAVRAVIDADGEPLGRYPLELEPVADSAAVHQLNAALVQVFERGTARSARPSLPAGLTAAGKTGTSSEFRDSWFAGFTNDYLAVVWVGRDDNAPTGLSGASGALQIWAALVGGLAPGAAFTQALPPGYEESWLDYDTGRSTYRGCGNAVLVPMPEGSKPPRLAGCGRGLGELGERIRDLFDGRDRQ